METRQKQALRAEILRQKKIEENNGNPDGTFDDAADELYCTEEYEKIFGDDVSWPLDVGISDMIIGAGITCFVAASLAEDNWPIPNQDYCEFCLLNGLIKDCEGPGHVVVELGIEELETALSVNE
jgi:hypothetical protein